ncbi:hypothetical protein DTO271D3_6099 [Paecilomyces variotii]|nr:hypothetical protein DTO271D3_6099 [Paecilomyces variotii]
MDHPRLFREFAEKVQAICATTDPQDILNALRELAEGRAAKLQDGTQVEALSGLGNQAGDQNPHESYTQTMAALLRWGVNTFPNHPLHEEPNLWETMALFDGPRGYNQRLISDGLYIDGLRVEYVEPPEAGLLVPVVPKPKILVPSQRQPIQPLDEDLPYISEFLRGTNTARAVVATRCMFGWPQLSLHCMCLYVDAEDTSYLANLVASQAEPGVVVKAELCDIADYMSSAQDILGFSGLSRLEHSERRYSLRKNPVPRSVRERVHHGQSISLMGEESKGSVGVFLSPCGVEQPKTYALTAYHVVPFKAADESRAIIPGGLDILSQLLKALEDPPGRDDVGVLVKRWNEPCGNVEYGSIGANQQGWRCDFALVRLDEHLLGRNGEWYNHEEMTDLYIRTEKCSNFSGSHGIVGSIDPQAGEISYKDGAATGCTAGKIGLSEALMFVRGTSDIATQETSAPIDKAKLITLHQLGHGAVCDKGDSGCGVFVPVPQEDGWKWAGQLVHVLHASSEADIGLMIPQSQVFQTLRENTGMTWMVPGV